MTNILIINGNPKPDSLSEELAKAYKKGAEHSGANCILLSLYELKFNPILQHGYNKRTELEPDLINAQEQIKKADHLVFVYPSWWGTYPALLKGFIDRVFLPEFAFKYRENSPLWDKLLKGKSARLIVTMDAPVWYFKLMQKAPGHNSMKRSILYFCGVKPVKITSFSPVKSASEEKIQGWLEKAETIGLID